MSPIFSNVLEKYIGIHYSIVLSNIKTQLKHNYIYTVSFANVFSALIDRILPSIVSAALVMIIYARVYK